MPETQDLAPVMTKEVPGLPFQKVVGVLKAQLASLGLTVVSEVDMRGMLKAQINKDISRYKVLTVCIPESAYSVITTHSQSGALLTSDIAVYEPVPGHVLLSREIPQPVDRGAYPKLAAYRQELETLVDRAFDLVP